MNGVKRYLEITTICITLLMTYTGLINYILGLQLKPIYEKVQQIGKIIENTDTKFIEVHSLYTKSYDKLIEHEKRISILELAKRYDIKITTYTLLVPKNHDEIVTTFISKSKK